MSFRQTAFATLFAALLFLPWEVANGQWAVFEQPWTSEVSPQELQSAATILRLTDDQQVVVNTLAADHKTIFDTLVSEGRAIEAEMRPGGGLPAEEREQREIARLQTVASYAERLSKLDQKFFDDLSAILEPSQLELWTVYRRDVQWRRLKRIPDNVPGGSINLNAVLQDFMKSHQAPDGIAIILEEYNNVMGSLIDAACKALVLHARIKWQLRENELLRDLASQEVLKQNRLDLYEAAARPFANREFRELHKALEPQVAIRATNRQFIERVVSQLSQEDAFEFREVVGCLMSPTWVSAIQLELLIQQMTALDSISEDQRSAITALYEEARQSIRQANLSLAQFDDERFRVWWRNPFSKDLKKYDEEVTIRRNRIETLLADRLDKVRSILTPDQSVQLEGRLRSTSKTN